MCQHICYLLTPTKIRLDNKKLGMLCIQIMYARRCNLFIGQRKKQASRSCATSIKKWQEVSFPVPWGEIRGKWWGRTDIRPILTLHGWQDNCGTYDRLIPLLNKEVGFLAIDLPGHGLSSHLPLGMYYHFTKYLITVKYIIRYFQWPKISLMGHSGGGKNAYVYTMLFNNEVDFCICIDGSKPLVNKRTNLQVSKSINIFMKNNDFEMTSQEPPSYSLEEIKQKIHSLTNGSVALNNEHFLMKRGIAPSKRHPNKYFFTRDARLKSGEFYSFSQNDLVQFAHEIKCPIFIAKATKASYYEPKENFYEVLDVLKKTSRDCDFHYVDGTHHVHLNEPEPLAALVRKFIQKYANEEDRSIGGLREENIVKQGS